MAMKLTVINKRSRISHRKPLEGVKKPNDVIKRERICTR